MLFSRPPPAQEKRRDRLSSIRRLGLPPVRLQLIRAAIGSYSLVTNKVRYAVRCTVVYLDTGRRQSLTSSTKFIQTWLSLRLIMTSLSEHDKFLVFCFSTRTSRPCLPDVRVDRPQIGHQNCYSQLVPLTNQQGGEKVDVGSPLSQKRNVVTVRCAVKPQATPTGSRYPFHWAAGRAYFQHSLLV